MPSRLKRHARLPVNMPQEMKDHLTALVAMGDFRSASDAAVHGISLWMYGLGERLKAAEALVAVQSGPDRSTKVIEFAAVGSRGRVSRGQ